MKRLVIDSSIIVKWLHQQEERYLDNADKIIKDANIGDAILITSELAKYEIGNALLLSKKVPLKDAKVSFESLYLLPIQFIVQSEDEAREAYRIAYEKKITYYDASFMALALRQDAILVTDNPKHQDKKISGLKVTSLKNYR